MLYLEDGLEDLNNRSRRQNIRIRGIPETVLPDAILPTIKAIFQSLLPNASDQELYIERAHRALRPPTYNPNTPRDIINETPILSSQRTAYESGKIPPAYLPRPTNTLLSGLSTDHTEETPGAQAPYHSLDRIRMALHVGTPLQTVGEKGGTIIHPPSGSRYARLCRPSWDNLTLPSTRPQPSHERDCEPQRRAPYAPNTPATQARVSANATRARRHEHLIGSKDGNWHQPHTGNLKPTQGRKPRTLKDW
ncbi:Hypothetical predicted protein [Pelobates cultripes]|uniref:Uncharacterized protein n=1 Tax=Pelobates cultripes TaxID=61616 RepID=A0AAD1VPB8_PELCU|nr:Hypothetical predicted protein [Pelobates cultripes]